MLRRSSNEFGKKSRLNTRSSLWWPVWAPRLKQVDKLKQLGLNGRRSRQRVGNIVRRLFFEHPFERLFRRQFRHFVWAVKPPQWVIWKFSSSESQTSSSYQINPFQLLFKKALVDHLPTSDSSISTSHFQSTLSLKYSTSFGEFPTTFNIMISVLFVFLAEVSSWDYPTSPQLLWVMTSITSDMHINVFFKLGRGCECSYIRKVYFLSTNHPTMVFDRGKILTQ